MFLYQFSMLLVRIVYLYFLQRIPFIIWRREDDHIIIVRRGASKVSRKYKC